MKPVTFLVKHAVARTVLVGGATALVTIVYFALLAWAILTNGGLGGPLALPGMIVASAAVFLFPATTAAELLRSRTLRSRFVEIPISSLNTPPKR